MPAFKSHSTDTVDVTWDAAEQKTRVRSGENRAYYAKIFAWYDEQADEGNKSDYKFIHHMISADGTPGAANTTACSSGIGVLNGGMGGTTIPQADRQGVYDHLARHLRDAGREPPKLSRSVEHESTQPAAGWLSTEHSRLLQLAGAEIWAMWDRALQAYLAAGRFVAPSVATERIEREALTRPGPKTGGVARVSIFGSITRRDSLWSMLFGGPTVENLTGLLRQIGAEPAVSTVVLDVDSPGGTVDGIPELAAEVRALAEKKQVVAMANSLMASGAYWVASQADEIVAAPEALVGSIGVFTVHQDFSKFMDQAGVKTTYISAGKYKVEGNPAEPLSRDATDHLQSLVDSAYQLFVSDVAHGRGVSPAAVRSDYGEGRLLTASAAKAAGMIDRVATADETLRRLAGDRAAEQSEGKRLALAKRRLDLAEKF